VETKEQKEFLKENYCSLVQGYFYDRPLNEDQFIYRLQQFGFKYPVNM
jgi:EAL domain-containing protein (putative c-di-GMP-specific phosphodiesterase class I)